MAKVSGQTEERLSELARLRILFEESAVRSQEAFIRPQFPTRHVIQNAGVVRTRLTNWLTQRAFELDADRERQGNTARLFSARDEILLAAASSLVDIGLPFDVAHRLALETANSVSKRFMPQSSFRDGNAYTIFRRGSDWIIARDLLGNMTRARNMQLPPGPHPPITARIFSRGKWSEEMIPATDIPPGRIIFDGEEFADLIARKIGGIFLTAPRPNIPTPKRSGE
jgi:hypothetical protein